MAIILSQPMEISLMELSKMETMEYGQAYRVCVFHWAGNYGESYDRLTANTMSQSINQSHFY